MEAVGQLTGGLAHDFNNMLTGILGGIDMVRRRIAEGRVADVDRFLDAAMQSGQRAAALTHRLLAFSRRQTLDSRPLDVEMLAGRWPTCCGGPWASRFAAHRHRRPTSGPPSPTTTSWKAPS
jgi:signal transduction histidine kinase